MLRQASDIKGYAIEATDGDIGTVSDLLFDDSTWCVRWLVVDTGNWLSGRKVLLPPSAVKLVYDKERVFAVKLNMQHIKDSPGIDTDQPVSRQMEVSVYDYYAWSPYWSSGFYTGGYRYMLGSGMASPYLRPRREQPARDAISENSDVHLRSTEAVTGYHIHASDGDIGHVHDFLIDDGEWSIRYLVVDTTNWWPGKKILVSTRSAGEIDWTARLVNLAMDRQRIKDGPAYDPSMTVDQAYDEKLLAYYGIKQEAA
jgi:sporulation protein YlmC with PRC-barrel domain